MFLFELDDKGEYKKDKIIFLSLKKITAIGNDMADTYQHLTNITSEQIKQSESILNNMRVDYKIVPKDDYNYSVYVDGFLSNEEIGNYFGASLRLSIIIEIAMIDSGYASKDEIGFDDGKIPPTLGSEDVYRPERADAYRNYIRDHYDEIMAKMWI